MCGETENKGPWCNWSPHFQCITIRGIFEVIYGIWKLGKLVILHYNRQKMTQTYAKLLATHTVNQICITGPCHRFCNSVTLHGGLIITIARGQLNENLYNQLASQIGMYSYLLSPTVLAFFEGPQQDSAVGIHFHAEQMKIDWPVPMQNIFLSLCNSVYTIIR